MPSLSEQNNLFQKSIPKWVIPSPAPPCSVENFKSLPTIPSSFLPNFLLSQNDTFLWYCEITMIPQKRKYLTNNQARFLNALQWRYELSSKPQWLFSFISSLRSQTIQLFMVILMLIYIFCNLKAGYEMCLDNLYDKWMLQTEQKYNLNKNFE